MSNTKQLYKTKISAYPQPIQDAINARVQREATDRGGVPIARAWSRYFGVQMLLAIERVEDMSDQLFANFGEDEKFADDDPERIAYALNPSERMGWARMPDIIPAIIEYEKQNQEAPFVEAVKEAYAALRSMDANRLKAADDLYHKYLAKQKAVGPPGKQIIKMGDWKWLDLQCEYSPREGSAGGHCGNVARKNGDNIFSLRDPDNHVKATFVLDRTGALVEMKGKYNKRPQKELHAYIAELLKQPFVKDMRPHSRYNNGNDFEFSDMSKELQQEVAKENPALRRFLRPAS